MKRKAKSDYSIHAVVNALRLLELFEECDQLELGVTEIARRLEMHKNAVFRVLATLECKGYVEQRDGGLYRLGTRCLALGRAYNRAGGDLLRRAAAILEVLAVETRETVHLGVLREFEVVHLDGREASQLLRATSRVGRRLPAHCTALGKVLLACGPEEQLRAYDRWLRGAGGPEASTDATIADRDKLFEHLRGVAVRRLALDLEECLAGLCCVAAPVFDETGRAVAALSVSGPSTRLGSQERLAEIGAFVASAAERLSAELGFSA